MKTVYLLGAGATKSHTQGQFPMINEIFGYAKKHNVVQKSLRTVKDEYSQLEKYVKRVINKNILDKNASINIEEIMTYVQIDNENGSKISSVIDQQIIRIILETINACCAAPAAYILGRDYDDFVSRINSRDTIITFNWDTILDDRLGRSSLILDDDGSKQKYTDNQYGNFYYELTGVGHGTYKHLTIKEPYYRINMPETPGYYLKMHGSIDWLYCNNESCRAYGEVFPVNINMPSTEYLCSECRSIVNTLIIPPVLNKAYKTFPIIRKIWNIAQEQIKEADKIVIWGYSFPPTDFYSKWLILNNRKQNSIVDVINPACIKAKNRERGEFTINSSFTKNIGDMFGESQIKYYEYYEDYKNGVTAKAKYGIQKFA